MLIVFGGLPGTGKSLLSQRVARHLQLTWLRIEAIEAALWRAGVPPSAGTGLGAYAVAHTVAQAQLHLGRGVVVDAVNPVDAARQGWRDLASAQGMPLRVIEIICSDPAEHQRRVENRAPQQDQPAMPTWADVLNRDYEPWTEPRLTVDTVDEPERCVERILTYCADDPSQQGGQG